MSKFYDKDMVAEQTEALITMFTVISHIKTDATFGSIRPDCKLYTPLLCSKEV